jgi:hypothetical protein
LRGLCFYDQWNRQDACFAGAINLVHVVCSDSDPWLASLSRQPSSESTCHGNTSCYALPSAGARTVLRMVGTFTFMQLDQQKSMVLHFDDLWGKTKTLSRPDTCLNHNNMLAYLKDS